MKNTKLLLFALAVLAFTAVNCGNNGANTKEMSHPLIGSWKLIEVSITKNYESSETETVGYSERNIVYKFQENGKLIVSGEVGDIFIFDDFKEGEHSYAYSELYMCPTCMPGPNLAVDRFPFEWAYDWLYYLLFNDDGTMVIHRGADIEGDYYSCGKTFIKLSN